MVSTKFQKTARKIEFLNSSFNRYLNKYVLNSLDVDILRRLSQCTEVYILSGVIRDFFLGQKYSRDLDIVVGRLTEDNISVFKECKSFKELQRNKFGGLKIIMDEITIDIWQMSHTLGLIEKRKKALPSNLIKTVFFNFSAIVYNYNDSTFLFDDDFCKFFSTGQMDVVYSRNHWEESCIISALYYRDKYNLGISSGLCRWIRKKYSQNKDFVNPQLSRFGRVEYSNEEILKFVKDCGKNGDIINIDGYKHIFSIYVKHLIGALL